MKYFFALLFLSSVGSAAEVVYLFPQQDLTPGATYPVTEKDVCVPGYTAKVRHVPRSEQRKVFKEYGIPWKDKSEYEVDHLISLELGGSNDIKNLWPEAYEPYPGAREKDVVENYLHREVCAGKISLQEAQQRIVDNWYNVYKEIKSVHD